jgi:hypothetical protein
MYGIWWIEGITPTVLFDSCYFLPTFVIVCSCHIMDAENNLKASAFEAVLMLASWLGSTFQTEKCI